MEMERKIETWLEFYDYICSNNRQNSFHCKVYRRIFSIISRNGWNCYRDGDGVLIEYIFNGFRMTKKLSKLKENMTWNKVPSYIYLDKLESDYGLTLRSNYGRNLEDIKVKAIKLSNGKIKEVDYKNLNDLLNGDRNVVEIYESKIQLRNKFLKENPDKFIEIDNYFNNGQFVMVLEDFLWYKRGQVIKKYESRYLTDYASLKSPKEVLENYSSITTTIQCDLNLELELPTIKNCEKRKFGCPRGCTNYCFSDSENKAVNNIYNIMKKYKEILNNSKILT